MQKTCVHANTPYNGPIIACGKPVFLLSHGFLCLGHYRMQQASIPLKPRKTQPRWRGLQPPIMCDEAIIAEIIATDTKRIAESNVETMRFGSVEPVYLRVVAHG